ncbi:hypothetical protein [Neorhizobium sp. NCHU2750]|uniref:hypothetical protein n=1 Tax=Neorhizobium sp. NCHU2750 TaxID=1825976 RepID=UPI000E721092|nr:hypothetical protein NCHU2750_06440 [Neorhizobium sp. NCHU2750]
MAKKVYLITRRGLAYRVSTSPPAEGEHGVLFESENGIAWDASEIQGGGVIYPSWVSVADDGSRPLVSANPTLGQYWVNGITYTSKAEFEAAELAAVLANGYQSMTLVAWYTTPANHSAVQVIWTLSDGTTSNRIANRRQVSPNIALNVGFGGVEQAGTSGISVGNAAQSADSTAIRTAFGWALNDLIVSVAGAGTSDLSASIPTGLNNIVRLSNYDTVCTRYDIWPSKLSTLETLSWTAADNALMANGDSFVEGGVNGGPVFPSILQSTSGRTVLNYGKGGNTIEQIMARQTRSPRAKNFTQIIWDGDQNGIVSVSDYIAKIKAGMAGYGKFIILPPFVDRGQTDVSQEVAIRDAMVAEFGSKVLDWRDFATLDGNGNPTDAMYFKTDGTDNIHGSTALMNAAATAVVNKLTALSY